VFEADSDDARRTVDLSQVSGAPYKGPCIAGVHRDCTRGDEPASTSSISLSPLRPFVQAFSCATVSLLAQWASARRLFAGDNPERNPRGIKGGKSHFLPDRGRLFARLCHSAVRALTFIRRGV